MRTGSNPPVSNEYEKKILVTIVIKSLNTLSWTYVLKENRIVNSYRVAITLITLTSMYSKK